MRKILITKNWILIIIIRKNLKILKIPKKSVVMKHLSKIKRQKTIKQRMIILI